MWITQQIPILRLEFHPSKNKVQRVGLSSHPQFHARVPVRDGKLFVRWGKLPVRDVKIACARIVLGEVEASQGRHGDPRSGGTVNRSI